MTRNRTLSLSLPISLAALALWGPPAHAGRAESKPAASDPAARTAKVLRVESAAVKPRCGRKGKLRRVQGGYICLKGLAVRRPKCRKRYKVKRRGSGWVCRRKRRASKKAAPLTPAAPQAAPNGNQVLLDAAFYFAKRHAATLLGNGPPFWTYQWLVDPKECSIVDADTARCVIYVWREEYVNYGIQRAVFRVASFAHAVGGGYYSENFQELDWYGPYALVCNDDGYYANVPDCSGPR